MRIESKLTPQENPVMRQVMESSPGSFTALIVQDAIFRSKDWAHRISDVSGDFVLVRFPDTVERLVHCCSRFENSIALIDHTMFDLISSDIWTSLTRCGGSVRLIARIEGNESADALARLLQRGCHGFASEHISRASLRRVLRVVSQGEVAATRKVLSRALHGLLAGSGSPKLSRREQDVMALLSQRLSNKAIAQQLFISQETLRWHLRNLYTKTGLDSRCELMDYAAAALQQCRTLPVPPLKVLAAGGSE
jgi:DNA-binding NarL/FixJ family response regulator